MAKRWRRLAAQLLFLGALAGCASAPPSDPDIEPPLAEALAPAPGEKVGPLLGLVLSGGAARGFAHVGVIAELEKHGYTPQIVVGTSAGAFVGALVAGGIEGAELRAIAAELSEDELRDIIFPDRGFVRGAALEAYVNRRLGRRPIEQLPKRFAAVATDLVTGDAVAFTRGNTGTAVRASSSIPGVFQPVRIRGRDYVDGGLSSPLPVTIARRMGADVVVAVDVGLRPESEPPTSTLGVILQAIAIMGKHVGLGERAEADVTLTPVEPGVGPLDFERRESAIAAGERAAREALPALRAAMNRASERVLRSLRR